MAVVSMTFVGSARRAIKQAFNGLWLMVLLASTDPVLAFDIVSTDTDWSTQATTWFKGAIKWATGTGLDTIIVVGVLGGLLLWNLAPKGGGLGMAMKGVASALIALPVLVSVLRIKNSF